MSTKKTALDYQALAASRGFAWISSSIPSIARLKTNWRCANAHEWAASYEMVADGRGCPHCAGNSSKTRKHYQELAESRGFRWCGLQTPENVLCKTVWECQQGHRWEARYNGIRQGKGCPDCANHINGKIASKAQVALSNRLGGVVNFKDCGTHIDVALRVQGVNVAIEYDGHYWHKDTQERDAITTQRLIAGGWRVLRIKGNKRDTLPTNGQIFDCIYDLINGWTYAEIDMNK